MTLPIAGAGRDPIPFDDERTYLLRRPGSELTPTLEWTLAEGSAQLGLRHRGHVQLAELRVRGRDALGEAWFLNPTGTFVREPALARTHLLVHQTGERAVELIRFALASAKPELVELEAQLVNPGSPQRPQAFAPVSEATQLDLRR